MMNDHDQLLNIPPESYNRMQNYVQNLRDLKKAQTENLEQSKLRNKRDSKARKLEVGNVINKLELDYKTKIEESKVTNMLYVPNEPNFLIVILVRSKCRISAKLNKVCDLLRLEKIHTAVIVKNNESIRNMLKIIKDYVAFGFISFSVLRQLLIKRGKGRNYDKHSHQFNTKVLEQENFQISSLFNSELKIIKNEKIRRKKGHSEINLTPENLSSIFKNDPNIRCVDDLALHLYTQSEYFKIVNNFLCPFKLNCPKGGYKHRKKGLHFVDGGILGNWHYEIENLLLRMVD